MPLAITAAGESFHDDEDIRKGLTSSGENKAMKLGSSSSRGNLPPFKSFSIRMADICKRLYILDLKSWLVSLEEEERALDLAGLLSLRSSRYFYPLF